MIPDQCDRHRATRSFEVTAAVSAALAIATRRCRVGAAEDAGAVGAGLVAPDLLFDQALERVEERALDRVGHHRSAPLGGLTCVASRARRRVGLVFRDGLGR